MTETKWTPGPWRVTGWDEEKSQALIQMDCNPPDRPDSWHWSGWVSTRTEANARLIASAPDLYKALDDILAFGLPAREEFASSLKGAHQFKEAIAVWARAQAALAKARGETP